MMTLPWLRWPVLLLALLLIVACDRGEQQIQPQAAPYILPQHGTMPLYLYFSATTAAYPLVDIVARTPGYIEAILFDDGQDVAKGQPLYTIEFISSEAAVEQARASLQVAQADAGQAELDYSRYQRLAEQGAVSKEDLDDARLQQEETAGSVLEAQAALTQAEQTLSYTQITAPFAGRIGRTLYDQGNLVGVEGDTVLTTLVKMNPLYAYFNVASTQLQRVLAARAKHPDLPVLFTVTQVNNDTPSSWQGTLDFIDNQVSATSGTIQMRAVLDNADKKLYPGQFGTIELSIGEDRDVLLIPQEIVKQDIEGSYVFTVGSKNQLQRKNITLGASFAAWVVVKNGLTACDHVISGHLLLMRAGLEVAPTSDSRFTLPATLHDADTASANDASTQQTKCPTPTQSSATSSSQTFSLNIA